MQAISILLVEDNDDHAELIVESLLAFNPGNQVSRLASGSEMIALLSANAAGGAVEYPDLILLDLKMPKVGGLEVLDSLKSNVLWQRVPVVMLSTSDLASDAELCQQSGASGFISKPLTQAVFLDTLKRIDAAWGQ
ncbi:response regulator [Ketobacter sp.]|uniref:response regulator n=1 Tax=Ketobacter sp. TaxID=2083498 RepID=UPI000F28671B|nr:response regulator [Ketobacter sp.]RLU01025.1 MAG: response regulator [Ketobacter sp.]